MKPVKNTKQQKNANYYLQKMGGACRSKIALTVLSFLGIIGVFSVIAYYILFPAEGYLHSDCTDTILWAQATYDSGKLVYDGFQYAAVLPFGGNLLMLIFMPFFGYSMTTHNLGMLLFLVLFILAAVWFCRSLGYGYGSSFLLTAILTFILSSSDKLREIMWGHIIYYSLGVLFFLFGIGLAARLVERREKLALEGKDTLKAVFTDRKSLTFIIILFVFALCTATNGLQSLITFTLPLAAALVLERIFDEKKDGFFSRVLHSSLLLSGVAVFTLVGLYIRKLLMEGVNCYYADAYSSYSDIGDWLDNLLLFPEHYFSLLGVAVKRYDPIANVESVLTMIRIFGGIAVLVLPLYLLFSYRKIEKRSVKMLVIAHFTLCAMIMYAYVFGMLATANWRLVPLLASSVITSVIALCELWRNGREVGKRVAALCLALLLAFSSVSAVTIAKMPKTYGGLNNLHALAAILEAYKLDEGYATFWNSQAITLLSDNKVKVRNIEVYSSGPKEAFYQGQFDWYKSEGMEDGCFLLVSANEEQTIYSYLQGKGADYVKKIDLSGYTIYIYERNIFD